MKKIIILAVSIVASQLSTAQAAIPNGLYGWTRTPDALGSIDLLRISETTGQATVVFSMLIPSGYQARDLTYNPDNGNFYGNLVPTAGGLFRFAEINPNLGQQVVVSNVYTGLGSPGIEGVEYLAGEGMIISGVHANGDPALYHVDPVGFTSAPSGTLPGVTDLDHLGANSRGGKLHVLDTNDDNNDFEMNRWDDDPFGLDPMLVGVYDGPIVGDAVDLAINPFTAPDTFYSSGMSRLLRYDITAQQQAVVGTNYNYSRNIWGIAYVVPEPSSSVLAFGLGLGGLWLRRKTRRP